MIRAAGILLVDKEGRALFLKRGSGGDNPGEWCFPGGRIEDGETSIEAAVRETEEEAGYRADAGKLSLWTTRIANRETTGAAPTPGPGEGQVNAAGGAPLPIGGVPSGDAIVAEGQVEFTTFLLKGIDNFVPNIDASDEHVAYAWAPLNQPPEPLHPGCRVALDRFSMDELGVAKAIREGDLTSPQHYANLDLFDLRITGTGVAYRRALDEFVYRRPEHYLTAEFLERCAGLPVIMMHPEGDTLDPKEFSDRIVGTMMLPYLGDGIQHPVDEVWGIAKIYDDGAAQLMRERQLSTSPAVVVVRSADSTKLKMEDGSTLLIEGKPALLDHLAICVRGVWDKGGEPNGVNSSEARKDSDMTDEEKKAAEEKARKDADMGDKLDMMLKGIDTLSKRMDSYDEERKADKARKDAAEAEDVKKKADGEAEEKAKEDKAKADAEAEEKAKADATAEEEKKKADASNEKVEDKIADALDPIRKRIDEVAAALPKAMSDADRMALTDAQAFADNYYSMLGQRAPRPQDGETVLAYRKRLAKGLREHSPTWKGVDFTVFADDAFSVAEKQIYADAQAASMNPIDLGEGELREIVTTDTTGRRISSFRGEPRTWMKDFSARPRRLAGIRNA
jgi:8-oxo-dGTP pyrophosphatase MutT (NUDIX family)